LSEDNNNKVNGDVTDNKSDINELNVDMDINDISISTENDTANTDDTSNGGIELVEYTKSEIPAKVVHMRKKRRKLPYILLVLLVLALLAVLVVWLTKGKQIEFSEDSVLSTFEYDSSSGADFYTYDEYIYYVNKNSVELSNRGASRVWEYPCALTTPVLVGEKTTVAVTEKNSTAINVYNETGLLYEATFDGAVVTFGINGTGWLSAVSKNGNNYDLSVYNKDGVKCVSGVYTTKDALPMAIDVSDDGTMYSVAFLDINGLELCTYVNFYYTNKDDVSSGQTDGQAVDGQTVDSSNGLFTNEKSEGSIPVMLKFTRNNRCTVLLDDTILFINTQADSSANRTIKVSLGNQIKAACVAEDGTLAIATGEAMLNVAQREDENTVLWYNAEGTLMNKESYDRDITGLYAGDDDVVVGMDRTFEAHKNKGSYIWRYTAIQETSKMLTYDGDNKALKITPLGAAVTKVGKGNEMVESVQDEDVIEEPETESISEAENAEAVTEAASVQTAEQVTEAVSNDGSETE
jgi:hypothetical protein